jgi:hypothetical protein
MEHRLFLVQLYFNHESAEKCYWKISQLWKQVFQKHLHEWPQNCYTCDHVRQW